MQILQRTIAGAIQIIDIGLGVDIVIFCFEAGSGLELRVVLVVQLLFDSLAILLLLQQRDFVVVRERLEEAEAEGDEFGVPIRITNIFHVGNEFDLTDR